jgi:predicted amino acid-binding ACT domain protein
VRNFDLLLSFDALVLLAEEETALQSMRDRLNETGRRCGVEKNVGKTQVMRV